MEITIRRLSAGDYSAVKMIEKKMLEEFKEYQRELEKRGEKDEPSPEIEPKYFKHYTSKEGSFIAETDGMRVGFILSKAVPFMHGEEGIVWMEQIMVLGGFRREGVGGKLLDAVEAWARTKKMRMLYTTLNTNNEPSKRLLMSRGFEVIDWRKAIKALVQ